MDFFCSLSYSKYELKTTDAPNSDRRFSSRKMVTCVLCVHAKSLIVFILLTLLFIGEVRRYFYRMYRTLSCRGNILQNYFHQLRGPFINDFHYFLSNLDSDLPIGVHPVVQFWQISDTPLYMTSVFASYFDNFDGLRIVHVFDILVQLSHRQKLFSASLCRFVCKTMLKRRKITR